MDCYFNITLVCNLVHMHAYNLKQSQLYGSNYTLFEKKLKLYMVLTYTFFKSYISKICNDLSLFIHTVSTVNLWFNRFMESPRKPLVLVSHIERIFPHCLPYKLWSEGVVYHYGTLLLRFKAYKTESGGRFFRCGILKPKASEDFP